MLSLALGVVDTITRDGHADVLGRSRRAGGATNAIALGNLGVYLAGAVGSIAAGIAIDRIGVASPFILSAVMAVVAAVCLVLGGAHARRERPPPHLVPSLSRSMTLITSESTRRPHRADRRDVRGPRVLEPHRLPDVRPRRPGLGRRRARRTRDGEADRRDRGPAPPRPGRVSRGPAGVVWSWSPCSRWASASRPSH